MAALGLCEPVNPNHRVCSKHFALGKGYDAKKDKIPLIEDTNVAVNDKVDNDESACNTNIMANSNQQVENENSICYPNAAVNNEQVDNGGSTCNTNIVVNSNQQVDIGNSICNVNVVDSSKQQVDNGESVCNTNIVANNSQQTNNDNSVCDVNVAINDEQQIANEDSVCHTNIVVNSSQRVENDNPIGNIKIADSRSQNVDNDDSICDTKISANSNQRFDNDDSMSGLKIESVVSLDPPVLHFCTYCSYSTETQNTLLNHLIKVHNVRYVCPLCDYATLLRASFNKHGSEVHQRNFSRLDRFTGHSSDDHEIHIDNAEEDCEVEPEPGQIQDEEEEESGVSEPVKEFEFVSVEAEDEKSFVPDEGQVCIPKLQSEDFNSSIFVSEGIVSNTTKGTTAKKRTTTRGKSKTTGGRISKKPSKNCPLCRKVFKYRSASVVRRHFAQEHYLQHIVAKNKSRTKCHVCPYIHKDKKNMAIHVAMEHGMLEQVVTEKVRSWLKKNFDLK